MMTSKYRLLIAHRAISLMFRGADIGVTDVTQETATV